MSLTGTVVDWPLIWIMWGGLAIIFVLGVICGVTVFKTWKLSRRKDV